ncbi:hypothetical protein HYALB_00001363 [Hymenoscyphus albidus]|uniref:Uncharacterized protein n=1 Tax=Hymenoscyphus albidus TaxID=595503 RepID=A0A9N9PRX4_9HELO|nr:hypothetical protein HYALB_00001363 [Hymenoscyphus albidus]
MASAGSTRPEVLLLSLALQPFFDDSYTSLIDALSAVSKIKRTRLSDGAIRYLEANNPKAAKNKAVLEKVKSYARKGGRVIIGLHFTCFNDMDVFDKFFGGGLGLQWRSGDYYHRTDFQFNPSCRLPAYVCKESLPLNINLKVLHIKNAQPHEKIFVPVPGAKTQSLMGVLPSTAVDQSQAAVAGVVYGSGFLFYVGDVNAEKDSDTIIMTLCGF